MHTSFMDSEILGKYSEPVTSGVSAMSRMSELDLDLQTINTIMGEPSSPEECAQDKVARAIRDAYVATAELYKLRLNPLTAPLLAKEEGELWSIHGRVLSVLNEIRAENAA